MLNEEDLLERLCERHSKCKECFCNDLCVFLLMRNGVATTCADFQSRVRKVVDREITKLVQN